MRALVVIGLVGSLAACDSGAKAPSGSVADGTADAAGDDTTVAVEEVADTTTADTTAAETSGGFVELEAPAHGFQIRSTPITIPAATESTWCYYFTIPNDAVVGVKHWVSRMTAGSHHLIVYFTGEQEQPDGTISQDCNGFGGASLANIPVWTYSAQTRDADMVLPDGVGMQVTPQQHGYIQMHYLNPSLEPLDVHVTVNGETFDSDVTYQKAAAFVTYNTLIDIPAGVGQTASAEGTCHVKKGISFFALSTHSHRRSVETEVKDAGTSIFDAKDWEHPGFTRWADGYTFAGDLTYRCDYSNDLDVEVKTGPSAQTNEMCMAVGYFYPAERPIFCINSLVVSQ